MRYRVFRKKGSSIGYITDGESVAGLSHIVNPQRSEEAIANVWPLFGKESMEKFFHHQRATADQFIETDITGTHPLLEAAEV